MFICGFEYRVRKLHFRTLKIFEYATNKSLNSNSENNNTLYIN